MNAVAAKGVVRTFQHSTLFHELSLLENVMVGCHLHRKPSLLGAVLGTDAADRVAALEKALSVLELAKSRYRQMFSVGVRFGRSWGRDGISHPKHSHQLPVI